MKKKLFVLFASAAFALGIFAGLPPAVDAGSCNGHGKTGNGNVNCRDCVVPPGCALVECNKCGCDVLCPQGMIRTSPVAPLVP